MSVSTDLGTSSRVYDIGSGARFLGAMILVFDAIIIADFAYRVQELISLLNYSVKHPVQGLVSLGGLYLVAQLLALMIWGPIRMFFPTRRYGTFESFSTGITDNGMGYINIRAHPVEIKTKYNRVLENALVSIPAGTSVVVLTGWRDSVSRIDVVT